jgi:predicted SAM-dependent methyltransferase
MLSRKAKVFYYLAAGPVMKINGHLYRKFKAPNKGVVKVHLGPGQKNYLTGWINVDANIFTVNCDVWADLRNPLPFNSDTVSAFYSHHMIEHLPDIVSHLTEVHRCLKLGGTYRVSGPNGDSAIKKFTENDNSWFSDFPDKRGSIGGRFENFVFCRGEHLTILTFSMLEEFLSGIGFKNIQMVLAAKQTNYPDMFNDCLLTEEETDLDFPHTLVIEATK